MNKSKIGILAACACALSYLALTPVVGEMCAAFPEENVSLVQTVVTLPTLMFIVSSPVAGILGRRLPPKRLLLIALMLYLTGGLIPFFFHGSIGYLLAGSVVLGMGTGLMMPTINTAICTCFEEPERGRMMGLNATFTAVGAMAFILLGGLLSRFGWYCSYLTFLLVIPMAALVLCCLEDRKPEQGTDGREGSGFQMDGYILALFAIGFVYFTAQNAFNTNSALYFEELGLGGAETASLATMCNTLGGILGGLFFGRVAGRAKEQIGTVALGLAGVGFLLAFFLQRLMPILAGGVLVGAGFAMFNAAGTLLLSRSLKPENNAFTVSIYMAVVNLGGAASPAIVNAAAGLFGTGTAPRFALCGGAILAAGALSLLVNRRHRPC